MSNEDDYLGGSEITKVPLVERGSFEDARTRLDAMVEEMATALTAAFPDCPPMTRDEGPDSVTGGGHPDDASGGTYYVHSQYRVMEYCSVSSTRERADTALGIVASIAERYDFHPHHTFNDRIAPDGKGSIAIEGWNTLGDRYSFGSSVSTVLTYTTSPRWAAEQLAAVKRGEPAPYIPRETFDTPPPTPPATPEPTSPTP